MLLGVLAIPAPAAYAYVAPGATIASASLTLREQGDDTSGTPDLSSDGRYVVFRTTSRNLFPPEIKDPPGKHYRGGVFRRDLATGALELVALGDLRNDADDTLVLRGADSPSVSGDGRYVAFSTAEPLVAQDTNANVDVYVRDLATGGYELASAVDGADAPLAYTGVAGSDVSPGVALSDDGRRVVFRTVDGDAAGMPAFQVFVRDLATRGTRLVTHRRGDAAVPVGGALGQAGISGDGTAVVWTGRGADEQVTTVPNESLDPQAFSYLWQRAGEETRRITGPTDPDDPSCTFYVPSDTATGPCYGPLADNEQGVAGIIGLLPSLSFDGYRVAFLTSASPRPRVAGSALDLFVTDMRPGVSRKAGTVELTRDDPVDRIAGAPLNAVALSPDGRWAAVTSNRLRFPSLRFSSSVRSVFDVAELYLVDLETRTIERAATAAGGGNINGSGVAAQLSVSRDARRVAFVSSADNLFFGDANQRADVFVVDRLDAAPPPAPVDEPPIEAPVEVFDPPPVATTRRLTVSVKRAPAYGVRLQVKVPVKGKLRVEIRGRVPDADGRPRGASKLLASKTVTVKKTGSLRVDVAIAKRYKSAVKRAGKLEAKATAELTPTSGGSAYTRALTVRFAAKR
ncbi:hypothetical protein OJ997_30985 [Solirubrobacter phytolaccae]|uniref:WD40 repeat protein n=1 Tax=Solirubrobacter phytolaccae TaxID=1404360 RepID=A0A9X3NE56_9ACTN|nr:hypothetical protein [Solirubrobacter phytolaccae]MDA0184768.1 hypothetical protein [Solirubrobacter phytolaccae]